MNGLASMNEALVIAKIETHDVMVPFRAPLQSGGGGQRLEPRYASEPIDEKATGGGQPGPAMERTLLVAHTRDGIAGLGEGPPTSREALQPLVGCNPFCLEEVHRLFPGEESPTWAMVEMACLDIQGKALGLPVCRVLNGDDVRPHVPHSGYCFFRLPNLEGVGGVGPDHYAEHCQRLVAAFGFQCLKLKMGVYRPELEVELVRQVRQAVGPAVALRMDVNGVWSRSTAVRALRKLEDCDLEYMEDPLQTTHQHAIHDYLGMAELRRRVQTPLAVDGNYRLRNLVDVIRYDCADVVLGDYYGCNGAAGAQQFYYTARSFNLALSMHSGYELGVATAARAHLAAAVPGLLHPIDTHYHQLSDDILAGGMLEIAGGRIALREEPGLGVALDRDKVERYRATVATREEHQRVTAQLLAKYERRETDAWRFEHGQYPQW